MQNIILNYYPATIQQIRDIQQIAEAEDTEFAKMRAHMTQTSGNMYIFTANEAGVERFERILGIVPEKGQKLEDRKLYILSACIRRKKSLSELVKMLSQYADIKIQIDSAAEVLTVGIGIGVSNIGAIFKVLDEHIPLNILLAFATAISAVLYFKASKKVLEMESATRVCHRAKGVRYLDGSGLLDGSRLLNSVEWEQKVELTAEATVRIRGKTGKIELTAQKNLHYLDGSKLLDGSRLLNAEYNEEVIKNMAEITTIAAKRKILLARAGEASVAKITEIALGDGGIDADGAVLQPEETQSTLKNEIYRKPVTRYEIISDTQIKYYCELDEDELIGARISEIALIDADGDAVTVKNFACKEKDGDFIFTFKINDTM